MLTVPWFAGAAAAFGKADPFLRRVSILLPMEIGTFFFLGRLNEARLFHGFLPILIGIYLCYFRAYFPAVSAALESAEEQRTVTGVTA